MTLQGTRDEWKALVRQNDTGVGLKDAHLACIHYALDEASGDALVVEVDAMLPALQQSRDRLPEMVQTKSIATHIADSDERWWLIRAHQLGLSSIRPVPPWPRNPTAYTEVPPEAGGPFATGRT